MYPIDIHCKSSNIPWKTKDYMIIARMLLSENIILESVTVNIELFMEPCLDVCICYLQIKSVNYFSEKRLSV